jgi:hypothetical protein
MIPNFHPSAGDIITGVALLLSVGLNGLLIAVVKDYQISNSALRAERDVLADNQKPVPWNKGKKGYKLPRKPKEATYVLKPTNGIVAAWDKDGKQTVVPNWEKNV